MKSKLFFCGLIMIGCSNVFGNPRCSSQDEKYLRQILRETWAYLDNHLAKETGFPTDSQHTGGTTNTTNIGLYLAAIGPAEKMGLISRADALERIIKITESVKKIESRNGFIYNWIDVGGDTKMGEGVMAVSDFNKLITGLILVRQFFPELADWASPLIERVNWNVLYDKQSGKTYWGYDIKNDTPVGLGNFWLASDCRLVMFYMIARGQPVKIWDDAKRVKVCVEGLTFYEPGYGFGGLFMSAMDAIFLDPPSREEMGSIIGDFAWHQITQAKDRDLKVWGWSNCNIPGKGYTEGGYLPWRVVTPHASALVIEYYPQHVIKNLHRLDEMGMTAPIIENKNFGFRDSIDLKTGKVDDRYLSLDQAMLFLSLTNYLEDGMVRKYFAKDTMVKTGFEILGSRLSENPSLIEKWNRRDASEPQQLPPKKSSDFVMDMKQPNELELNTNVWGGGKIEAKFAEEGLIAEFDFGSEKESEANIEISFPEIDIRNLNSIEAVCSGSCKENFGGMRLYLYDDQGQSQYTFIDDIKPEMKKYIIFESSIYGMLAKSFAVNKFVIKLWAKPWYYTNQRTTAKSGKLVIEKIIFK